MILPIVAAVATGWAVRKFFGQAQRLDLAKFPEPKAQFAAKVYNAAFEPCKAAGVPLSLALAQAAVETGWGRAVPGGNLYGLKGKGPAGTVNVPTKEEGAPGEIVRIRDNFRAFNNWQESVAAWCRYVTAPRNRPPVSRPSAASWLVWYWSQGYATSSRYPFAVAAVSRSVASKLGKPDLAITLGGPIAGLAEQLSQVDPKARQAMARQYAATKGWPA